ncbi:hypothetical protein HHI36_009152 [Cryptolaemus montrouzieri]|uniref:Uncharacterized protein n=1 Tax=Cryptolaemus montrouzieri TaxID=559131 RepID=A0ABD2MV98_9CUCU
MDRRRKSVLTKLKSLMDILDEEESQNKIGDNGSYNDDFVSRGKYPTCKAMVPGLPSSSDNISFQSTLRRKAYPLVPYRENVCIYDVHECSPSTTLCVKPVPSKSKRVYCASNFSPLNVMYNILPKLSGPSSRNNKYRSISRRCPRLCVKGEDYVHYRPSADSCENSLFCPRLRTSIRRSYSGRVPARCIQSREIRGGIMHHGCDCNKTNGLQDRCERFCCIGNPKCRHTPANCYLSRFSGGNHLSNSGYSPKMLPTYEDYSFNSDSRTFQMLDPEDETLEPSYADESRFNSTFRPLTPRRFHPYNDVNHIQKVYVPMPPCIPRSTSRSLRPSCYPSCCGDRKILTIPEVVYDSSSNHKFEPTEVCVVCPLSYLESPCHYSEEW